MQLSLFKEDSDGVWQGYKPEPRLPWKDDVPQRFWDCYSSPLGQNCEFNVIKEPRGRPSNSKEEKNYQGMKH